MGFKERGVKEIQYTSIGENMVKGEVVIYYHDEETRDKILEFLKTVRTCSVERINSD